MKKARESGLFSGHGSRFNNPTGVSLRSSMTITPVTSDQLFRVLMGDDVARSNTRS
jgi:hypothetical protein